MDQVVPDLATASPQETDRCGALCTMKVAIVHEWFERCAGSERVVEQLIGLLPQADIYGLVDFMPSSERAFLGGRRVQTSFIQRLPFARQAFRSYLPVMPLAIEQLDLTQYDLILSSSHAVAKGVITGPGQLHISYVHSPMRYAWDLQTQYLQQMSLGYGPKGLFVRSVLHRLRNWDVRSANGVDVFVANSTNIAERIRKFYRRDARVVAPPVDTKSFIPAAGRGKGGLYLVATRLTPYKRVDLVVEAFRATPARRLLVVGTGPELDRVRMAGVGCPNIEFRAPVSHSELIILMQTARAFIHAAQEDFGIAMAEAQACGTPVIAFARGGARDIVVGGETAQPTGILFKEQTARSLLDALALFERWEDTFSSDACRANALRFSVESFRRNMTAVIIDAVAEHIAARR
jgi:glycosyltransferase involved in cell wall biosynthesis